jgi:hypothetical protein
MKKYFAFSVFILFSINSLNAQTKQTQHLQQIWGGYFNQTRLSNKWGFWAEQQLRTKENFVDNLSTSITRVGGTYYFGDNTKLTLGYAFVNSFPGDNHANISQPEHRIWQQLQWHTKYGQKRMMQWFRLEERYRRKILNNDELAEGYNFNYRIRYNFLYQIPLSKKGIVPKTFSFVVNDEVHVNFGKEIVNNYFDQNRFFLGFNYQISATDNFQFGYANIFQQLSSGNSYKNIDVIRLYYFQNFDLRKKK